MHVVAKLQHTIQSIIEIIIFPQCTLLYIYHKLGNIFFMVAALFFDVFDGQSDIWQSE